MYGVPGSAPYVDSRELRPRRIWYLIAGLISLVGVISGLVVFLVILQGTIPEVKARFTDGEPADVVLSGGETWAIYMDTANPDFAANCVVLDSAGSPIATSRPSASKTFSRGPEEWVAIYTFAVPRSGTYRFNCSHGAAKTHTYAVAKDLDVSAMVKSLAAFFLLPFAGLVAGAVIATVVGSRRSKHRKTLLAWRAQPPPPYYPPHYPPR